jgi:hypothetical protein
MSVKARPVGTDTRGVRKRQVTWAFEVRREARPPSRYSWLGYVGTRGIILALGGLVILATGDWLVGLLFVVWGAGLIYHRYNRRPASHAGEPNDEAAVDERGSREAR